MTSGTRRILLGMSGGVDSAVSAHLLQEQGWDVVGITLDLWRDPTSLARSGSVAPSSFDDARSVCDQLGMEHHVIDRRALFRRDVVDAFCADYLDGQTPNPCVLCNPAVKFATLESLLREFDASAVATGHYARAETGTGDRALLRKGMAQRKEQSYFLSGLSQRQLASVHFPLGLMTKKQTRKLAKELDLPVHAKSDSQEVCFIPDDDYAGLLEREMPEQIRAGVIVDTQGVELGRHEGIHRFTLGQRKGLGIALGEPRYVLSIDPVTATVVVGRREETFRRAFTVRNMNWVSIAAPAASLKADVKIRSAHAGAPATVEPSEDGSSARIRFDAPESAITPGQAAVLYDGDLLLGGGFIDEVVGE